MTIKLDYQQLTSAASSAEELAQKIRTQAASARSSSPVALPSLEGIETKATWLEEQATMLNGLADVAVLLDSSGEGTVSMSLSSIQDKLNDMLGDYLGAEFANIFGNDDDFPLIALATALGKMTKMSRGVAPVFQTGIVGRSMLTRLAQQSGRAGEWARWMLNGPRHAAPPAGLLKPPKWVNTPGSPLRNAGWGSPSNFRTSGLGAMRGLGIVGGVVSTGAGVANLVQQGNPIEAFEREGAGYVADVAETAFSASTTAFLVAPNPVTGALAVGSGLVWAGAEVVDNWDDISETASKAWDKVSFWD
jgi:hypothetical protein